MRWIALIIAAGLLVSFLGPGHAMVLLLLVIAITLGQIKAIADRLHPTADMIRIREYEERRARERAEEEAAKIAEVERHREERAQREAAKRDPRLRCPRCQSPMQIAESKCPTCHHIRPTTEAA